MYIDRMYIVYRIYIDIFKYYMLTLLRRCMQLQH